MASSYEFYLDFISYLSFRLTLFVLRNAEAGNIETVLLKDFNPEAYNLCFDLMYGELEVLETVKDPRLLFQLFGLVQKYMVAEEIVDLVRQILVALDVTKDNIVSALETVVEFKNLEGFQVPTKNLLAKAIEALTFESVLPALQTCLQMKEEDEEMRSKLLNKVVEKVKERFPDNDPTKFYLELIHEHQAELEVLMQAVAVYSPDTEKCSHCLEPMGRCKDGKKFKAERVKPFVGLRVSWQGNHNIICNIDSVVPVGNNSYKVRVRLCEKVDGCPIIYTNVDYEWEYPRQFSQVGRIYRYKCKD